MWKWIVIVVIVLVVAGSVYVAVTDAQPVDAATARRGPVSAYIEERARTRLPRTFRVTMPIAGRILPIELTEGDVVTAGQVVARLDSDDLDTAVAMAAARVRRLEPRSSPRFPGAERSARRPDPSWRG